jgi:hypothetical protein
VEAADANNGVQRLSARGADFGGTKRDLVYRCSR